MKLVSWLRSDVPVERLAPLRRRCLAAYDRVEHAPLGQERRAAWAAYALVTYGDKVLAAGEDGRVDGASADFATRAFAAAAACLEPDAAAPPALPRWRIGTHSERQLRGMSETLDALQTFVAFAARACPSDAVEAKLAAIDACRSKVARLWVPRPTADPRGGIAAALVSGLDQAYGLGLELAG